VDDELTVRSDRRAEWNTTAARLIFTRGAGHSSVLGLPGDNLGPDDAGYVDNFAWGALELPAGLALSLRDGNSRAGGAIYVRTLSLGGGTDQIGSITGNGLSIYYDPGATGNAYLAGGTYPLVNGGFIAPVPEPVGLASLILPTLLNLRPSRRRRRASLA
jgi:hypothetical protein